MNDVNEVYKYFNNILDKKFSPRDWTHDWQNNTPVPKLVLDGFLPENILNAMYQETQELPDYLWTNFTRNRSLMRECKIFDECPVLQTVVNCFNSGKFITWLEDITKKTAVISDPHLVGAGLSKCYAGNSLKLHTDFNWNDELQLNRTMSMIYYFNPFWKEEWGGSLEFWDFDKTKVVDSVAPLSNRLLIWDYDDRLIHGYPQPLSCPEDQYRLNLRLFYYRSNSTPITTPHRSLYWWDEDTKTPYDDRTQV